MADYFIDLSESEIKKYVSNTRDSNDLSHTREMHFFYSTVIAFIC